MIKKIDNLGRVVVPKGFRQMLGLEPGDTLRVEIEGGKLLMTPHRDGCTFCGETGIASVYLQKNICNGCLDNLRAIPPA